MVLAAAQVCEDKKGTDIRILELDPVDAGFTDFFLIASGTNNRQTGAIADEIELRLKRDFAAYAKSVEGRRQGEWILLDYVDFVVHIFTEQTREFYDIERLRKSARSLHAAEFAAALKNDPRGYVPEAPASAAVKTPAARKILKKASAKKASKKSSPVKRTSNKKTAVPAQVTRKRSKKAMGTPDETK